MHLCLRLQHLYSCMLVQTWTSCVSTRYGAFCLTTPQRRTQNTIVYTGFSHTRTEMYIQAALH